MQKSLFVSKTAWLGVLQIVVAVLQFLGASPLLSEYAPYILLIAGVATIVLRSLTTLSASPTARVRAKDVMR